MSRFASPALERELRAVAATYREDGFALGDLLRSAGRRQLTTSVSDVTRWLTTARSAGQVVEIGYTRRADGSLGPLRYRLAASPVAGPVR
jgi:hypothetical protein